MSGSHNKYHTSEEVLGILTGGLEELGVPQPEAEATEVDEHQNIVEITNALVGWRKYVREPEAAQ